MKYTSVCFTQIFLFSAKRSQNRIARGRMFPIAKQTKKEIEFRYQKKISLYIWCKSQKKSILSKKAEHLKNKKYIALYRNARN